MKFVGIILIDDIEALVYDISGHRSSCMFIDQRKSTQANAVAKFWRHNLGPTPDNLNTDVLFDVIVCALRDLGNRKTDMQQSIEAFWFYWGFIEAPLTLKKTGTRIGVSTTKAHQMVKKVTEEIKNQVRSRYAAQCELASAA